MEKEKPNLGMQPDQVRQVQPRGKQKPKDPGISVFSRTEKGNDFARMMRGATSVYM
jgi:hypothetical protein